MKKLAIVFCALAVFAAPAAAAGATMDNHLSAWAVLGFTGYDSSGFGAGVRYQKTVVPEGLIKSSSIRDDVGLEGGVDFVRYSWGVLGYDWAVTETTPVIGAVWNFWFTPQLALYPKIDLGYHIASVSTPTGWGGVTASYGGFAFQGAAGIVYKLEKLTLRAEVGSYTLRAGVGFVF